MITNSVDQKPFNQAPPDEPLQPTEVVHTGSMPVFVGLKNKVQLSISLLMNLCLHDAHKCPNNHPNPRQCGLTIPGSNSILEIL